MSTEFGIALGLLALALLYRFWPRGPSNRPPLLNSFEARRPGRLLIDTADEVGKEAAGVLIENRLGEHRARQIGRMFADAFSPAPLGDDPIHQRPVAPEFAPPTQVYQPPASASPK